MGVPRISEKLHEIMVSDEEAPRTMLDKDNVLYMHYKNIFKDSLDKEFSSKDVVISKDELKRMLIKYNYFKV